MSEEQGQTGQENGQTGQEGGQRVAQEGARFAGNGVQRPEYIPEKFWKDGKPDVEGLSKSYVEIERRMGAKTEELMQQVRSELTKDRPADATAYKIPEIEGVDAKILGDHPLVGWWRGQAFSSGLGQKGFEDGIRIYIEDQNKRLAETQANEMKALGDNAKVRVTAVQAWAEKSFSGAELEAVREIATTASGVSVLEKFMKQSIGGGEMAGGEGAAAGPLTIDQLKAMQNDPRYWDPARRDPAFVKKIEDGYANLYPKK